MKRLTIASAGILLCCAPAGPPRAVVQPAVIPGPALESTPAGVALSGWLAAYNTGRSASHRLWFKNYGTLTPVRVDSLTPSAAVATVREGLTGGWGVIYLDVDSAASHPITGVSLLPSTEPISWSELTVPDEAALVADVRGLADRLARADAFSGVVLLMRGGQPLLREAFGLANRASGRRNTPDIRFELASVSKMFTAVAVLRQVERMSGLPFSEVVTQQVFARAGMSSTSYRSGPPALRALGYTHLRPGSAPGATPDPDRWYPSSGDGSDTAQGSPAGGGVSTADDLARFAAALMEGRLLGPDLTRRAMTGYVATEYGGRDGYGLETRSWNGVRIVGHGGGFTGVSNQVDFHPDLGYVLVVLGNSDASGTEAIANRVRAVIASSPALYRRP